MDSNDDNLGFFHRWVEEFARLVDRVEVIAVSVGEYQLPENVLVWSLDKQKGAAKYKRLIKFLELFSQKYAKCDAVFFHMMPEFVIAAAPFLISLKKSSALWYVHKSVTLKLKFAEKLVRFITTASPADFRLPSKKVIYTGHAIDIDVFSPSAKDNQNNVRNQKLRMLSVGRISPVKDYELIIGAVNLLNKKHKRRKWQLDIIGAPIMKRDYQYLAKLKQLVKNLGLSEKILFKGAVAHSQVPEILRQHNLFISCSNTGSLDKAVLEAMSCGLNVITSNEAFKEILPKKYFLEKRTSEALADKIMSLDASKGVNYALRRIVAKEHSIKTTIPKIIEVLAE